jgi:hypothetical protein
MSVYVLDRSGKPLMPCSEKRARLLLERGRARVHRVVPFVIRLIDRKQADCAHQPLRIKLDPGSRVTGLALVRDVETVDPATAEISCGAAVLNLFELVHRGRQISEALTARRQMRRQRRGNLRYRAPRFLNRTRPAGWLAPSLQHRVDTTMAWVKRLRRWTPISAISSELVRFDMQAMENPEISGSEYQQGTLAGYEVREYLLEKWGRRCAYGDETGVPLQVEHSVGKVAGVLGWRRPTLQIKATGRGSYQRTRLTAHGFPRGYLMRQKQVHGFQTGDRVRAEVPSGNKAGIHIGRVAVRASGSFNIQTGNTVVQGIGHRYCRLVQRNDGYGYALQPKDSLDQGVAGVGRATHGALSLSAVNDGVSRAI